MKRPQPAECRSQLLAAIITAAWLLPGCSAASDTDVSGTNTDPRLTQRSMTKPLPERVEPLPPVGEPGLPPEDLLARVLEDATQRSGLERGGLEIVDSRRVTWSDGSLGCPEPGMNYTQALVPGWHLLVAAGAVVLDYRVAEQGYFRRCELRRPGPQGEQKEGPSEEGPPKY